MNSNAYDRQYDKTIPTDAPEVARIMRDRGVGRRRATHLLAKQRAESIDVSDINMSQKELVLTTLVKHRAAVKNSDQLGDILRRTTGINYTDGHDVVKMLWACQKMGWVTFRERKANGTGHPAIYAIKITPKGYTDAADLGRVEETPPEPTATVQPSEEEPTYPPTTNPHVPITEDQYPLITAVLARADKEKQLAAAARILEEAGEEDLALTVMGKIEFTPLEKEVIALCGDSKEE